MVERDTITVMVTRADVQGLGPLKKLCKGRTITVLILIGILFFFYMGLQHDVEQSTAIYTYNTSGLRSSQPLNWPKRTQSKPCNKGSSENETLPTTVDIISINHTESEQHKSALEYYNVHNATQRPLFMRPLEIIKNTESEVMNISTIVMNITTNIPSLVLNSTLNETLKSDSLSDEMRGSTVVPEIGCDVPCPPIPPGLVGSIDVNKTEVSLKNLNNNSNLDLMPGGRYAPRVCKPRYKVAIVIPYRDREAHLAIFLNNIHPFLMKQQIDYQIFIVEQKGHGKFNRASLMNVGFVEALKLQPWDCFIFHDVDLLPMNDKNLYTCPTQPRHLSAAIDKFDYKLPYKTIFGGVSALTTEQFKTINGFSNSFWGWGGEDDDMANRISFHNYHISRYPMSVARYTMLDHDKEKPNQERYNLLTKGKKLYDSDGLNNLQYTLAETQIHKLYTLFLVELHPPS